MAEEKFPILPKTNRLFIVQPQAVRLKHFMKVHSCFE